MGDSLLVVGGRPQFKVHVHTDEPGQCSSIGDRPSESSREIEIDNMKEQTAARDRRLAQTRADVSPSAEMPG